MTDPKNRNGESLAEPDIEDGHTSLIDMMIHDVHPHSDVVDGEDAERTMSGLEEDWECEDTGRHVVLGKEVQDLIDGSKRTQAKVERTRKATVQMTVERDANGKRSWFSRRKKRRRGGDG